MAVGGQESSMVNGAVLRCATGKKRPGRVRTADAQTEVQRREHKCSHQAHTYVVDSAEPLKTDVSVASKV